MPFEVEVSVLRRMPYTFVVLLLAGLHPLHANAVNSKDFVRIREDSVTAEPLALETSIVSFTCAGVAIDLVAAVHLGEENYYQQLNERFRKYDAVLFELIADKSFDRLKLKEAPTNALGSGQVAIQQLLGLSYQLQAIDYRVSNFVHADLSPQEFLKRMDQRGESISSMLTKILAKSASGDIDSSAPVLGDLFMLVMPQYRQLGLKRALARELQNADAFVTALNGSEGSTLVSDRNQSAINTAKSEIAQGKSKLAIYYGAAHMGDMSARLVQQLQCKQAGTQWLTAWKLAASASVPQSQ